MIAAPAVKSNPITLHRVMVNALASLFTVAFLYVLRIGIGYYSLPIEDRPAHPLHHELRPSGAVGLGFGFFSTFLFALIYLYPLRKRWLWLRRIGDTRHWLDFHIVMGLAAPFLVALHSAFKFGGVAGMSYWCMLAVVLSGVAGRYLYAQIPRTRRHAELSLLELQKMSAELGEDLHTQHLIAEEAWLPVVSSIRREEALQMPLVKALWIMLALDLARPFRMAALRRPWLSPWERVRTIGGLLASGHQDLERVVILARRQSWLTGKICFLDRAGQIFRMWHVVHRPFSSAFLILLVIHIATAMWMGFF